MTYDTSFSMSLELARAEPNLVISSVFLQCVGQAHKVPETITFLVTPHRAGFKCVEALGRIVVRGASIIIINFT